MKRQEMKRAAVAMSVFALMVFGATRASADTCTGKKIKAIGKKEKSLLACSAKEATRGTAAVQPACNMKASDKFTAAYNNPTGCTTPPATQCESIADDCQAKLRAALPDGDGTTPSKCESVRLKAAGKKASAKLSCYAKAAARDVAVDPNCLTKAETKFSTTYNKVTGCATDGPTGESNTEAKIDDECVNQLVTVDGMNKVIAICPTTTTTTTILPPTTTLTLPVTTTSTTAAPTTTTNTTAAPTTTTSTTASTTTSTTAASTTTSTSAAPTTTTTTATTSTTTTTNPACTHDVCTAGAALDSSCDACAATVCAQDSSCCTSTWDSICVGEACTYCGAQCPGTPCAPPTCTDGIQNGSETDVDCGGGTCPTCANGLGCQANSDCTSGNCMANVCQP